MHEGDVPVNPADEPFMRLAIVEAEKGLGRTSPNPCVGAVIVHDNGTVISSGYHKKAGTPHAEIHALQAAGKRASGATLYVTLEPCNHAGRTPPCSHAVAAAGLKRVVVGLKDPNPLVNGGGVEFLRKQGIEVTCGVLHEECRELIRPFLKHISTGRPFVVMKAGMSLDGRLSYQKGIPGRITGKESLRYLHKLRNCMDAILVGRGTLVADNPSLTTRLDPTGRDPVRVVLDSTLSIALQSKILHLESTAKTLIFCSRRASPERRALFIEIEGVEVYSVADHQDGGLDLGAVLDTLGTFGICSLLVEGGSHVHGSFLRYSLVDRVMLFVAPVIAGSAGNALVDGFSVDGIDSAPRLKQLHYIPCGEDLFIQGDFSC